MSFLCEEYRPQSPYVEAFWRIRESSEGTYMAAADGQWDLAFINEGGDIKILLSGPSAHATPVYHKADNHNFGIRFRRGVFLPHLKTVSMVDTTVTLPTYKGFFWLHGQRLPIPAFNNLDSFVARLARRQVIAKDTIVTHTLAGYTNTLSNRSVQRHFLRTTGMTHTYLQQIDRAKQAIKLLQAGTPLAQVASDTGYADQAHMNRALKYIAHKTPKQIAAAMSFPFNPYLGATSVIQVQ